jgi:hypothetical protein
MKLRFLSLLLMTAVPAVFASSEPSIRPWTADTPGVDFANKQPEASGIIQVTAGEVAVVPVLRDTQPGLKRAPYILRGEVKYDKVGGTGFLEMWNVFPPRQAGKPEERYFSRALGEFGPMQRLQGSSAWREFILPFNTQGAGAAPVSLELNVVLPDGGTVWLRNLRLTQWEAATPGWITSRSAPGVVGGTFGALIGVLGGLIGTCVHKGKGRAVAKAALVLLLLLAIVCAGGVVWAATMRSLRWVISFGVPAAIAFALFHRFRAGLANRFDEAEMRRMQAADA